MAKKATFAAASFSNLRAATGEGTGEPLRIALVDIDEDPNQPRRSFDEDELHTLAATIKDRGVLQPIGVQPPEGGRYLLVFGARRFRAAKLAGQADIPAVIVSEAQRDFATQVIENQQRANLSNSELARAVNQLHSEGKSLKEIAAVCNLKDYQVSAFRSVEKLPPFLAERIDNADMRAIYDLFRAWQKQPAEVEATMPEADAFLTVTDARRVVLAVTGKSSGSIVLDREREAVAPPAASAPPQAPDEPAAPTAPVSERPETPAPAGRKSDDKSPAPSPAAPGDEPAAPAPRGDEAPAPAPVSEPAPVLPPAAPAEPKPRSIPVFIMALPDGRRGFLVTDKSAGTKGRVLVDVKGEQVEATFTDLQPVDAD